MYTYMRTVHACMDIGISNTSSQNPHSQSQALSNLFQLVLKVSWYKISSITLGSHIKITHANASKHAQKYTHT